MDVQKLAPNPVLEREASTLDIIEEIKQKHKDEADRELRSKYAARSHVSSESHLVRHIASAACTGGLCKDIRNALKATCFFDVGHLAFMSCHQH